MGASIQKGLIPVNIHTKTDVRDSKTVFLINLCITVGITMG